MKCISSGINSFGSFIAAEGFTPVHLVWTPLRIYFFIFNLTVDTILLYSIVFYDFIIQPLPASNKAGFSEHIIKKLKASLIQFPGGCSGPCTDLQFLWEDCPHSACMDLLGGFLVSWFSCKWALPDKQVEELRDMLIWEQQNLGVLLYLRLPDESLF